MRIHTLERSDVSGVKYSRSELRQKGGNSFIRVEIVGVAFVQRIAHQIKSALL